MKKPKKVEEVIVKSCWCDNISGEGIAITLMIICGFSTVICLLSGIWSGNEWWFKPGITSVISLGVVFACWGIYEEFIR